MIRKDLPRFKKVPPDGGWGWIIVFACILFNSNVLPIFVSFGVVYREKITELQLTGTQILLIINICSAISMSLGPLAGPLLHKFGNRKIAIIAGSVFSAGLIASAYTKNYVSFLICIMFVAIGIGFGAVSFSIALNTYFMDRRSTAHAISMAIGGILVAGYPLAFVGLMQIYETNDCILILGTFSLNTILAASLLQPVKWHLKRKKSDIELLPMCNNNDVNEKELTENIGERRLHRRQSIPPTSKFSIDDALRWETAEEVSDPLNLTEKLIVSTLSDEPTTPTIRKQISRDSGKKIQINLEQIPDDTKQNDVKSRGCFQFVSYESVNLGSSFDIFAIGETVPAKRRSLVTKQISIKEEEFVPDVDNHPTEFKVNTQNNTGMNTSTSADVENGKYNPSTNGECYTMTDILLRNHTNINVLIGLSASIFSDTNFNFLIPFLLSEMKYSTFEIACCVSVLSMTDIFFRFLIPFTICKFQIPPRLPYTFSLVLIVFARLGLMMAWNFHSILIAAFLMGIVKGLRNAYVNLVLPGHIQLEMVPIAGGVLVIFNCTLFMILGPILGLLRDWSGNFGACVTFLNCTTALVALIWFIELLYTLLTRIIKRKK